MRITLNELKSLIRSEVRKTLIENAADEITADNAEKIRQVISKKFFIPVVENDATYSIMKGEFRFKEQPYKIDSLPLDPKKAKYVLDLISKSINTINGGLVDTAWSPDFAESIRDKFLESANLYMKAFNAIKKFLEEPLRFDHMTLEEVEDDFNLMLKKGEALVEDSLQMLDKFRK